MKVCSTCCRFLKVEPHFQERGYKNLVLWNWYLLWAATISIPEFLLRNFSVAFTFCGSGKLTVGLLFALLQKPQMTNHLLKWCYRRVHCRGALKCSMDGFVGYCKTKIIRNKQYVDKMYDLDFLNVLLTSITNGLSLVVAFVLIQSL